MSVLHSEMTGSDLHEPKGVASATAGTVYVADGAGSGSWADPLSDITNLNSFDVSGVIDDVSTANSEYRIRVARDCTLTHVYFVIDGALAGTDAVVSLYRDGVLLGQSKTLAVAGSGDGIKTTLTLSPTYTFTEGQVLTLRSDGASTNAVRAYFTAKFTV